MALILSIESATSNCAVALHRDAELLALKQHNERNIHAGQLFVFIADVMKASGMKYQELDAIAVSKGPGSYTGLRIGVSAAKGLCYSLSIPLLSVNTLKAMAYVVQTNEGIENAFLIPMLDARRMEVYCAAYDRHLDEKTPTTALIVDQESFREELALPCYFFGEGMPKCREILSGNSNAFFIDDIEANADAVGILAYQNFVQNKFEDTAYFEPYYLKEFVSQSVFHKK